MNVVSVGGDFGGRETRDLPVAYLLAKMAQRPVKIVMSYGEELTASNPTHPTVVTIRSGVTRDGRLTARAVRTVHASGAYGAMKPRSFLSTPTTGATASPTRLSNFSRCIPIPQGVLRAWGAPIHLCPRMPYRPAGPGTGDGPGGIQAEEPCRSGRGGRRAGPSGWRMSGRYWKPPWKRAGGASLRPGQTGARASPSSAVRSGAAAGAC